MFVDDHESKPADQLRAIEKELGFAPDSRRQDWGVELADPSRLDEFIGFFAAEHSSGWSDWTRAEYLDLVIQSAQERLENGQPVSPEPIRRLSDGLGSGEPVNERRGYWKGLDWEVSRLVWPAG